MARDRRLSRDFWLHEFSGWEHASDEQAARLEELAARVLQPLRTAFGVPVYPSSWIAWSDGTPRTGVHAHGGAVDVVVSQGLTRDAWAWGREHLIPSGYVGRWIYEPQRGAPDPQGEHLHVASRGAMVDVYGDPVIQVLEETSEGSYVLARTAASIGAGALALLGALLFFVARRREAVA